MLVALFGKKINESQIGKIKLFIEELKMHSGSICIYKPYAKLLSQYQIPLPKGIEYFNSPDDVPKNTEIFFSMGGDGTILEAILLVKDSGIPIIGVNSGKLGFLTAASLSDFPDFIDKVFSRDYKIDQRNLIRIEANQNIFGDNNFCLNEFTIYKGTSSSMITIHTYLDGEFLNSYWADGLIVSTPTGSTAYSLSCGGPILMPGTDNFVITPIAPHNLNVRPVVVPNSSEIFLEFEGRTDAFFASLDSRSTSINSSIKIMIKKSDFKVNLIRFREESFFKTLRNKLFWGIDKRN